MLVMERACLYTHWSARKITLRRSKSLSAIVLRSRLLASWPDPEDRNFFKIYQLWQPHRYHLRFIIVMGPSLYDGWHDKPANTNLEQWFCHKTLFLRKSSLKFQFQRPTPFFCCPNMLNLALPTFYITEISSGLSWTRMVRVTMTFPMEDHGRVATNSPSFTTGPCNECDYFYPWHPSSKGYERHLLLSGWICKTCFWGEPPQASLTYELGTRRGVCIKNFGRFVSPANKTSRAKKVIQSSEKGCNLCQLPFSLHPGPWGSYWGFPNYRHLYLNFRISNWGRSHWSTEQRMHWVIDGL